MRKGVKLKRRRWRYFYYLGDLHKTLTLNRGLDEILAWNYPQHEKRIYSWIDVKRNGHRALTRNEVARIVDRSPRTIQDYMYFGKIKKPQHTYSFETGNMGIYLFSRDDVFDIYELIRTSQWGRPRHDDFVTARRVPDRNEVRAAALHDLFMYAKGEDGEFVPVWKSEEF